MKGSPAMTQNGWQRAWIRTVTTLLTASVMVMIFCFSMENAAESDQRSGTISMAVIRVLPPEYETMELYQKKELYDSVQFAVRKCAHFTEYMILGALLSMVFLTCRIRWKFRFLWSFLIGALYAFSDEFHQMFVAGRSMEAFDVLIDSSGVIVGIFAALGTAAMVILGRSGTFRNNSVDHIGK